MATLKRSLKYKFVRSMCMITLVVLVITSGATLAISLRIFQHSTENSMEQLAMAGYLQVDSWFQEKEMMVRLIADELEMYAVEEQEEIEYYLSRYMQGQYPYITDVYVVTPDNAMYSAIGSVPAGVDWHTRYWYYGAREAGELVYTSPYISSDPGNPMIITLSLPIRDRNRRDMGVLAYDIELSSLIDFVNNERILDTDGRAFLLDEKGEFIAHENAAFLPGIVAGREEYTSFDDDNVGIRRGRDIFHEQVWLSLGRDHNDVRSYIATVEIDRNQWVYGFSVHASDFYSSYLELLWIWLLVAAAMILLTVLLARGMSNRLLVPIKAIINTATSLSQGDMEVDIDIRTGDELQDLSHQFRKMLRSNSEQIEAMKQMAEGDLTVEIAPKSDRDTLSITINYVIGRLRGLISHISESISMFNDATGQIASASTQLAVGSTQQTTAVEQLSASLDNISRNTKDNARLANNASKSIGNVRTKADMGIQTMENMYHAVEAMGSSTNNINQIIHVIEDIAFQTNILALNAAVEAARAGQAGKGFAVVAEEVRTLSTHSAKAAQEITSLISASSKIAGEGLETARETQQALNEILDSVQTTTDIVEEIDAILDRQVGEIEQITQNMNQITKVVQQNSATAQQTAATSQQMHSQSQMLHQRMGVFRFHRGAPGPDSPPSSPPQGNGMQLQKLH